MENRKSDAHKKSEASSSRDVATLLKNERLVWIPALAVLVILALIVGLMVATDPSDDEEPAPEAISSETSAPQPSEEPDETLDSDGDGLPDLVEIKGWKTAGGKIYRTDPDNADTDSDGLSDSEETGELISGEGLKAV